MKTEEKIKEAMEVIKEQLTTSSPDNTISLQGQYAALGWVLGDDKKEDGFTE